jgi:hypothetical protein
MPSSIALVDTKPLPLFLLHPFLAEHALFQLLVVLPA